jgi:flagellar basal-body rod modification protein FlgD
MAALTPVSGADIAPQAQTSSVEQTATNAFGLGFEDLLRIVLTQLTYQDPLKPMDNFEFVSQLAQFSQIQQTQTMSDRVLGLLQAQATNQATSVLGHFVDIPSTSGSALITGKVTSVSFQSGEPQLTVETRDGRTLSGIALTSVSRIGLEE